MHQDDVKIPSPCTADWSAMTGDAQRRFCDHCQKHVHDLSAMTEPQAQVVLAQPEVCVRYTPTASGDIRFRPASRRALLRQGVLAAGLLASLPAAAAMSPAADTASESPGLLSWLWSTVFGESPVQGEFMPAMGAIPVAQDTGAPEVSEPEPEPEPKPVPTEISEPRLQPMMGRPAVRPTPHPLPPPSASTEDGE